MNKLLFIILFLFAGVELAGQELAVSTNLVEYVNLGTMNLDASYGFARHWSVEAGVKYNPFSFGEGEDALQNRQRAISAGAKYWPWHIFSGWWVAGHVRYQEYNAGGLVSAETSEGDRFGSAVQVGYTFMVSRHFNLNLGAGIWAGRDVYKVYACPSCGRILDHGSKFFVLPSDIIVALAYIF